MEFDRLSSLIPILLGLIMIIFPVNAAVVSVYASFEHLKIPFNQWYHGGNAEIVEENENKILKVSGGTVGRVLGVDLQYSPFIQVELSLKVLNSTNSYLRIVAFGYPMSSEGYKEEREICGFYVDKEAIYSFNGSLNRISPLREGWNRLKLNLDLENGIASVEYGNEKYVFDAPKTRGKYLIFRVDPGMEVFLDEVYVKAGLEFEEFFDRQTFTKTTPSPTVTRPTATPVATQTPVEITSPTPDFDKLKIILDRSYEVLYKTQFNSHNFYIVKYYNYLPSGTGIEVVTERGLKIGIGEKDLVKNILETLNTSDVEKEILFQSWEDRQNGVISVYVAVIAFLLFLLGLIAVIIWKT
jgi:hypothetical protein